MSARTTRRGALGAAATGAGGFAAAKVTGPDTARGKRRRHRKVDVVVVGAGIAGLVAARELTRKGKSVAVLEARRRVGGRTLNRKIQGGEVVEIGGQWVGPTQDRILRLIDELGLETFDTYVDGDNIYYRDGTRQTYTGTIPPANPGSLAELVVVLQKLNDMAATVPADAPWKAAKAQEWDGQTMETWKLNNTTLDESRDLVDLAISSVFAAEPRDLSFLFVLFYIAAAGDINNLINTADGAQESRIVGGSHRISIELAKRLGRRVHLQQPVRVVRRIRGGVEVVTRDSVWKAKRVILTLPPALIGGVRFDPKLPPKRAQLDQRVPMGSVIKCMAIYDEPFWRGDGLSGMATSDTGPIKLTFDNSPPDGSPGVLLGFMEGQDGRNFSELPKSKRREAALDSFERYFGAKARHPNRYLDKSWIKDRWSRGCYVGFTPPGVLLGYGDQIREPVGPIHWAGTETARVWNGYMDGAAESGQRVAAEVLNEL